MRDQKINRAMIIKKLNNYNSQVSLAILSFRAWAILSIDNITFKKILIKIDSIILKYDMKIYRVKRN